MPSELLSVTVKTAGDCEEKECKQKITIDDAYKSELVAGVDPEANAEEWREIGQLLKLSKVEYDVGQTDVARRINAISVPKQ